MGTFKKICGTTTTIDTITQSCFQKIRARSVAYHKTTAAPVFVDLAAAKLRASWETAIAPVDPDDTVVVLPQIVADFIIAPSEPITNGGDGDYTTPSGTEEVEGQTKPMLTFNITNLDAANNAKVNKINSISQVEGLSMFFLDPEANIIWGKLETGGGISGLDLIKNSVFMSTPGSEGTNRNIKNFSGKMQEDWDEVYVAISPTDFTVAELISGL